MSDSDGLRAELEAARQGLSAVNDELRRATAQRVRQAVHLTAMKAVTEIMTVLKAEAEHTTAAQATRGRPDSSEPVRSPGTARGALGTGASASPPTAHEHQPNHYCDHDSKHPETPA
jgi:hypothetical protein